MTWCFAQSTQESSLIMSGSHVVSEGSKEVCLRMLGDVSKAQHAGARVSEVVRRVKEAAGSECRRVLGDW